VLLLEAVGSINGGLLTGKLFEYMVCGAPVICVGDGSDHELTEILRQTGIGMSFGNAEKKIKESLLKFETSSIPIWFNPDINAISEFSREYSSMNMFSVICGERT